ncbi:MAG: type 1 glutamine amidotransferase [Salinisphaeraceae bacterium]|nr:type 1 glutamine amidotransferase [Salinisphaeraceae bacterium]
MSCTRWFAGEKPPTMDDYDWLIVMGGPMSVHDEADHPWLASEKQAIRAAIDAGKAVLGICLGAQLIAHVLGAEVGANTQKEIGWFPVKLTQNAALSPLFAEFNTEFDAFHWHGDRFDCPRRALRVALSKACDQQAFTYNERVVGLQFHLETTTESARAIIRYCAEDLGDGEYVQSVEAMLGDEARFTRLNTLMGQLLDGMSRLVKPG